MWGGRFTKDLDEDILKFSSSISYDKELLVYDIIGSIAHAKMLGRCKIIPAQDSVLLVKGLQTLKQKYKRIKLDEKGYEDVHHAVTELLRKEVGDVADKLHVARSRNDQVVLDVRMYCKDAIKTVSEKIKALQICFLTGAKKFGTKTTMPSYTHLKEAQCILLSHQLLAYIEMLERDKERLSDAFRRVDVLPLGSVAHRGTRHDIDRSYVAKLLGFSKVSGNSIDAVSDRDFVIEILSALSILSMHLSRIAEDFIIWSSDEFGFVEGSDAHYTGSSMMPHKKNPDPFELVRGYCGKVYGDLVSVLTMMKGLPLIYDRDMQLDKPALFDAIGIVKDSLTALVKVLDGIKVDEKKLEEASKKEFLFAADISEFLASTKRYSNLKAHEIAGKIVLESLKTGKSIKELDCTKFAPELNPKKVKRLLDPMESVKSVRSFGGTSPGSVKKQIDSWQKRLK